MSMIQALFTPTMQVLEKSLALRMMRQGMLASNIANVETPNYRAVDIDFKATMARVTEKIVRQENQSERPFALRKTDARHVGFEDLTVPENPEEERIVFAAGDDFSVGNDNNSVNLEDQMARMQSNTMMYQAVQRLLSKQIEGMRGVIERSSRV